MEKIGLAQINTVAGSLGYNALKIMKYIKKAESAGIKTIYFPQNSLFGNKMSDVIKRHPFLLEEADKWLNGIAAESKCITVYLGLYNENFVKIENGNINRFENYQNRFKHDNKFTVIVNQSGATDNKYFTGESFVLDSSENLIARAKAFEEQLLSVNLDGHNNEINPCYTEQKKKNFSLDYEDDLERTYNIIVNSIKDYYAKCGLKRAVLGLSGGLDSTVCAALLTDALGKENVIGVSMPSKITSQESKSDAKQLAENLGIHFVEASIKNVFDSIRGEFDNLFTELEKSVDGRYAKSYTNDNIQARVRATYLWGISNEFSSCIPIATSDKSEAYMGYATINGDMSGGFAPIADVTKTKLFALARWINKNKRNVIPQSIINKRPGAELAIDEKTGKPLCAEDALMPYEFLDEVIWRIENKHECYKDMLDSEFVYEKEHNIIKSQKEEWLEKFFKRMSSALYKWSIMPPAVILSDNTINKSEYNQPITSGRIDYKGITQNEINILLQNVTK